LQRANDALKVAVHQISTAVRFPDGIVVAGAEPEPVAAAPSDGFQKIFPVRVPNAIRVPSCVHCGKISSSGSDVNRTSVLVMTLLIQMSSLMANILVARARPSGDMENSP
jgi:hypothetical protein